MYRNFLSRHIRAVLASAMLVALSGVTLVLAAGPVINFAPRQFTTQQTHYLRYEVDFNSCLLAAGTCSVKVGAVPYNSSIVRAMQQIITSFNSATTDTLSIGISSASGNELVAAQSVHGAAGGLTDLTVISTARGTTITGSGATQTGANGGFDIWVNYVQTGAAPTAGKVIQYIEYIAPNDGTCKSPTPLGTTAVAC